MPLVCLGPVLIDGRGDVGHVAPCMAGHAHSAVEDLYRGGGGPHFHLLLGEVVGDAVPVVVELHVVINVDAVRFPVAVCVTFPGQGTQGGFVQRLEQTVA
jgi:hypothetical protein